MADEELISRQSLPASARIVRAAALAYSIATTFVVQSEPQASSGVVVPHVVRSAPRAGNIAYHIATTPPIQSEPQAGIGTVFPNRAPAAPRAANSAYWRDNRVATPDTATPPGAVTIGLQSRHRPRAASVSYSLTIAPQIGESATPAPERSEWISQPVTPLRRSVPAAYWVPQRHISLEDVPPPQAILCPSTAPASARATPSAYGIAATFIVQDEPQPYAGLLTPHRATAAARASASAYGISSTFVVQSEPQPGIGLLAPHRAPAASRAPASAYSIASTFGVVSEPQTARSYIPTHATAAQRSPSESYWVPQRSAALEIYPGLVQSLPYAVRSAQRAAPTAYLILQNNLWLAEELPPGDRLRGHQDTTPKILRRAIRSAYCFTVDNAHLVEVIPQARGYIDSTPRPLLRARRTAYTITTTPVIFLSTGGPVTGSAWVVDARTTYQAGPEQTATYQAGGEQSYMTG